MAFLEQTFSVEDLPVSINNFEPLPEGWYTAAISGAEIKTTKAGNGQYINVKYTIPVWWNTPDLTHFDLEFKDGNQVFTLHPGNYSAWADLELDWLDREIVAPGETGNIVFADFGKDDTK
jgi:hypothetical protein